MEKKPTKINFALRKVATKQFAIIEKNFSETGKISLGIGFNFIANAKQNSIAVFILFQFESDNNPFLVVEGGCYFGIKEDAWLEMINESKDTLIVPKGFMCHMSMLTIGTNRGILHSKTEGTKFNKYFIPTINVTELIKEDVPFSLKSQ